MDKRIQVKKLKGVDAISKLLFDSKDLNQDEKNQLLLQFLKTAGTKEVEHHE